MMGRNSSVANAVQRTYIEEINGVNHGIDFHQIVFSKGTGK